MNRGDLGSAEWNHYLLQCASSHSVEVHVELQNSDGETLVSFDGGKGGDRDVTVMGGEVAVDADSPTGRILTLVVADPGGELTVAQDANYIDRWLHVEVGVPVPALGKTISRTVFEGPIVNAPRAGEVITFTAHGKARYGLHGIREITTYPKGMPVTTAIKRILIDLCGEVTPHLGDIPDLAQKLQEPLVLHINAQPYIQAQRLAEGLTRHLQYSAGGMPQMPRTDSTHVAYTFTSAKAAPGMVSAPPEQSTDILGTIKNAVRVIGGATKTTKAPYGYAFAEGDFSPQKLGRGDSEAYFWDLRTVKTLHTQQAVDRTAAAILARDLIGNREVKFESMPMYVFDEYDLVAIETTEVTAQTHLRQFTIPLDIGGSPTQSYGFNARRAYRPFAGRR